MIEITFLGTSCMVPTKERNVQGIFLSYKNEGILIDCGEGTQRQMNIAGINRNRITKILISHWHGDHVSGLIGLLQTLSNIENNKAIDIFGPKETKARMELLLKTTIFYRNLDIRIHELKPKKLTKFFENEDFYLECIELDHLVPCLGFNFVEKEKIKMIPEKLKKLNLQGEVIGKLQQGKSIVHKGKKISPKDVSFAEEGKKISFVLDTAICNPCYELSKNADLLISEAAYSSKLEEKAESYKHMTAKQAALVANKSNAKKLILTHISQRYKTGEEVLEDAKNYFENSEVAYDFMKVKV